jgi:hypothetical protein
MKEILIGFVILGLIKVIFVTPVVGKLHDSYPKFTSLVSGVSGLILGLSFLIGLPIAARGNFSGGHILGIFLIIIFMILGLLIIISSWFLLIPSTKKK